MVSTSLTPCKSSFGGATKAWRINAVVLIRCRLPITANTPTPTNELITKLERTNRVLSMLITTVSIPRFMISLQKISHTVTKKAQQG